MNREDDYIDELETVDQDPLENVFDKIEQANLYKALLSEQLFEDSSASPEVVEKVTEEIRNFVSQRLQTLVGLAPAESFSQPMPFSDQQIAVLKVLADRIVNAPVPRKENSAARQRKSIVKVQKSAEQKPNIQSSVTSHQQPKRAHRPRSSNVSEKTGQDYSQAVNPNNRPIPQPSQETVNARNAEEAAKNSANMNSGDWGRVLQAAATVYQKKNANIVED